MNPSSTSAQPPTPTLKTPPRYRIVPESLDDTDGLLAVEMFRAYVGEPYDWQEDLLKCWLARRADGKLASPNVGLSQPRQNGKTFTVVGRIVYGAAVLGEAIRYSAHRIDTMRKTWKAVLEIFGDNREDPKTWKYPEMHILVKKENFANGDLSIELINGGVIYFVSRAAGSGRGHTVDVSIYDEAQILDETQIAAALPAQSAAPLGDPQVIYLGTPPNPLETGSTAEMFSRIRKSALSNESKTTCWHEWSVDEIGDVSDEERWKLVNPSLDMTLSREFVRETEYLTMSPEQFAIERLGFWSQAASLQIIDEEKWKASGVEDAPTDEEIVKQAIGIKFSPAGQACTSIAVMKNDGTVHAELIDDVPQTSDAGMTEMIDWLVGRQEKLAFIAIDGKSGAGELYQRLMAARTPEGKRAFKKSAVTIMKSTEVPIAASMVLNGLSEGTLTHYPNEVLDASAISAERRMIGTDGVGFGGDSCAIESFAAAVWAVRTTRRNPSRKARWK